jgi:hypothetical protein
MCFFYVVAFVKITVRDLEKECLLAPKSKQYLLAPKRSNAQTAKCPRLARLGAESVTTFPSGVISANAKFVEWTNARIACSSV